MTLGDYLGTSRSKTIVKQTVAAKRLQVLVSFGGYHFGLLFSGTTGKAAISGVQLPMQRDFPPCPFPSKALPMARGLPGAGEGTTWRSPGTAHAGPAEFCCVQFSSPASSHWVCLKKKAAVSFWLPIKTHQKGVWSFFRFVANKRLRCPCGFPLNKGPTTSLSLGLSQKQNVLTHGTNTSSIFSWRWSYWL